MAKQCLQSKTSSLNVSSLLQTSYLHASLRLHTLCRQRWSKQTFSSLKKKKNKSRIRRSVWCLTLDFQAGKCNVIVICSWSSLHTPTQAGAGNRTPPRSPVLIRTHEPQLLCSAARSLIIGLLCSEKVERIWFSPKHNHLPLTHFLSDSSSIVSVMGLNTKGKQE